MDWVEECPTCKGKGKVDESDINTCSRCNGKCVIVNEEGIKLLKFLGVFRPLKHTHDELMKF